MIVECRFPRTLQDLMAFVRSRVGDARSVAVQAGHFLVYYDHTEDQLLPCVASELDGPRQQAIRDSVGHFPLLTWDLGLALLQALPAPEKRILVLVNDWQYLPKGVDRARFYKHHCRLPNVYREALTARTSGVGLLSPPSGGNNLQTGEFFSEQALRNQYGQHIRRLIETKALPANAEVSPNGEVLSCSLVDVLGRREEIYCANKSQNCAHEVAELIFLVRQLSGCEAFINLFPLICRQYVEAGTELAFDLFQTSVKTVLNVGMTAAEVHSVEDVLHSCETTVHART